MSDSSSLFLFATGAGRCVELPALIGRLLAHGFTVYSVLTPNVALVAPPEDLVAVPGNHWIRDYGQPPLDRYPFGTLLVAPCTFNTLNKLAHGIADNLATSMIADGLGAGCPVVIAPAMNRGLWAHPQAAASVDRLRAWGCEIVGPVAIGDEVSMAPLDEIVAAVLRSSGHG